MVDTPRRAHAPGRGLAAPPGRGARPLRERRPRLQPHLVERRRRPSEPDVPGPSGPGLGHALLAPEGGGVAGKARGPLRRRLRRYDALDAGLSGVAGQGASGPRTGGIAPAVVAGPSAAPRR